MTKTITLGAGCFWCVEHMFKKLEGVTSVRSGYSGGHVINPSYREVCGKQTGHAEVIEVEYDPNIIEFTTILEIFWNVHDPTTLNRQGNDVGPQYRSAIFYHDDEQRRLAEEYKAQLDASGKYKDPIVTEITEWKNFFPAEDYHTDYFALHGSEPYCNFVVRPKVEKFEKQYKDKLK